MMRRIRSFKSLILALVFSAACLLQSFDASAIRFLYGTLSWRVITPANPLPPGAVAVEFLVGQAGIRSAEGNPNIGSVVPGGSLFPNAALSTQSVPVSLTVTQINPSEDWYYGEFRYVHIFPSRQDVEAFAQTLSKSNETVNNKNGIARVSAILPLASRPTNFESPVISVPPRVFLSSISNSYDLKSSDDGSNVSYQLTPNGSFGLGNVQPSVNGLPLVTVTSAGRLSLNTTGLMPGVEYNTNVTVRDNEGASTQVDFLLKVRDCPRGLISPQFVYGTSNTPADQSDFVVLQGNNLSFDIVGSDATDGGKEIRLTASGIPAGALLSPSLPLQQVVVAGGSPSDDVVRTTFSWTPGSDVFGRYQLVFMLDDGCLQVTSIVNIEVQRRPNEPRIAGSNVFPSCVADGQVLTGSFFVSDPDAGDQLTISLSKAPEGMVFTPSLVNPLQVPAAGTTISYTWNVNKAKNSGENSLIFSVNDGVTEPQVFTKSIILNSPDAGPDQELSCSTTTVLLKGTTNLEGASLQWSTENGSFVTTDQSSADQTVNKKGTYVFTTNNAAGECPARDTVKVTFNSCITPGYNPENEKNEDIIGPELTAIAKGRQISSEQQLVVFNEAGDKVYIEIIPIDGQELNARAFAIAQGFEAEIKNPGEFPRLTGLFPINKLLLLNTRPDLIRFVIPLIPPVVSGVANTQGDTAMSSDLARLGFDLDGEGIKVGVLSDSYNTLGKAGIDVSNGDLPGGGNPDGNNTPVEILLEYPFGTRIDEGRAMLQIIHDVAPKAALAFRTGFLSAGDFAIGIESLALAGCKVITDDITYVTEPFFAKGQVATAVEKVVGDGVSYFTSAGNFGKKAFESVFSETPIPAAANLTSGMAHNFGNNQPLQRLRLNAAGTYSLVLQWDNDVYSLGDNNGAQADLDIYLTDVDGEILFNFNRNNIGKDPIEILPFQIPQALDAYLMVVKASGTTLPRFKYILFRGDATIFNSDGSVYGGASTIFGHANSPDAMSVGAVLYTNTPRFGTPIPTIASFSSIGGGFFNGSIPNKPDFAAPNGVNTSVDFKAPNFDNDGSPNFFGTSAAAPHAAGVAALIHQARSRFYSSTTSASVVRGLLQSTALDMGTPGFDFITGAGFIQADAAIAALPAAPKPVLASLQLPAGLTQAAGSPAGAVVALIGSFFDNQSTVLFNGSPIAGAFVNSGQISVTLPAITPGSNPTLAVRNDAKSPSGLDGGLSAVLPLFGGSRLEVVIRADNKQKAFADQVPALTATITVGGETLQDAGLTADALGLGSLQFQANVIPFSQVGRYLIRPKREFDETNPDDAALLGQYTFRFVDGALDVLEKEVRIVPKDKTATYGQDLRDIELDYQFDDSKMTPADKVIFLNLLREEHNEQFNPNALVLIDGRFTPEVQLTNQQLQELGLLVSNRAVARGVPYINGIPFINGIPAGKEDDAVVFVNLNPNSFLDYAVNNAAGVLRSGVPFINGQTTVGGVPYINETALINSRPLVRNEASLGGNPFINAVPFVGGVPFVNGQPYINNLGYTTRGGVPFINGIPYINSGFELRAGVPFINGQPYINTLGAAGEFVLENGIPKIGGVPFINSGEVYFLGDIPFVNVNGLYLMAGVPYINSGFELRSGVPFVNGQPYINGGFSRIGGVPYINGIPFINGIVTLSAGGVPLINGEPLINSRGFKVTGGVPYINGVPFINAEVDNAAVVNGRLSVAGGVPFINGQPYINGSDISLSAGVPFINGREFSKLGGVPLINSTPLGGGSTALASVLDESDRTLGEQSLVLSSAFGITGFTVGRHIIIPGGYLPFGSLNGNISVRYATGNLTITPAEITIKADDKQATYGENPPPFTATVSGVVMGDDLEDLLEQGIRFRVTRNNQEVAPPFNSGTLQILPRASLVQPSNYTLKLVPGNFVVGKATLIVKADDKGIYYLERLPQFTATITGWKNNDRNQIVGGPDFRLDRIYNGILGDYRIIPSNLRLRNNTGNNYNIQYQTGTLYVMPRLLSHRVEIRGLCVIDRGAAQGGFRYVARFEYINRNLNNIYIPHGLDNRLTAGNGNGGFSADNLPTVFAPGRGVVEIPFNGNQLTWSVRSFEFGVVRTSSATLSRNSGSCPVNAVVSTQKAGSSSGAVKPKQSVAANLEPDLPGTAIFAAPNPTTGKVVISSPTQSIKRSDIQVMDAGGKNRLTLAVSEVNSKQVTIDLSRLPPAMYMIRVKVGNGFEVLKVMKQ